MGIVGWFKAFRDDRITSMILNHMMLVESTVEELALAYENLNREDIEVACSHMDASILKEKDADELRRRIISEMERSKLSPEDREDLLGLLRNMDQIADWAKEASRITKIIDFPSLPSNIRENLWRITGILLRMVRVLERGVRTLFESPQAVAPHVAEIEMLEEEVDEIEFNTRTMLMRCTDVNTGRLLMLRDLINALESIADNIEDTADYVQAIAVRRM